ncbi:MAG: MlaD family protein [Bacteroidales bacterium]|nr:MlaD family protein [Bacteroidales bacterium]
MKRNIRIGIFALASILIVVFGINYLKGEDLLYRGKKLYALYDNVDGLSEACPVIYSGFKIGSVRGIDLIKNPKGKGNVFCVTFAIEANIDIPMDSRALVCSTDILGGKGVELHLGSSDAITVSGDTINAGILSGLTDQLMPMKDKAESLMGHTDEALVHLLQGENGKKLDDAIASMSKAMQNFEVISNNLARMTSQKGDINGLMTNLNDLSGTLSRQNQRIDSIMINFSKLSDALANNGIDSTMINLKSISTSLDQLVAQVKSSEGTLGKVINDKELYENVDATINSLNELLIDIKANPSRYINVSVFGKK